jgi:hypothetical protein
VLALVGFRTTYTGWTFLAVGVGGLVLGVLIGHLANALRQPMITVAVLTVAVFFLLGGAVALRAQADAGVLPTAGTVRGLADVGIHGWKELLTILPPVDGSGPLLVIPYILGLLCGAGGFTLARRVSLSAAPVFAPAAVLAMVILLGTGQPAAQLVQGVVFGCVGLCWAAARGHRNRPPVHHGAGRLARAITGAAVILFAAGAAALVGGAWPGASSHQRVVLRSYVTPPFDIGAYPSPLVGFRKYTKDANQLWDQTLFTVAGLPADAPVRIATLDDYDGSVWGATNDTMPTPGDQPPDDFQRVGSRIPAAADVGRSATVRVTIGPAYALANDLNAWVPDAGAVTSLVFTGSHAAAHTDSFRYDLATSAGIVADRLRAGDTYTVRTTLAATRLPANAQPAGEPTLAPSSYAFVASRAVQWANRAGTVGAQIRAVATHLRDSGAYSDGGPGETQYLPGHGVGRLTTFLNSPQVVGNDEQYAAAFALMVNDLGIPARVVLGAVPEAGGAVRGRDVHAWVEVRVAGSGWTPIPQTEFMPDTSKKPNQQPPQEEQDTSAAVVPPPNPVHPPSTVADNGRNDPNSARQNIPRDGGGLHLPQFLITILTWFGPPALVILAICGAIVGAKAWRRYRRRTAGDAVLRFATGWREIVDHARDLGLAVPVGWTRREEARLLSAYPVASVAAAADAGVFGPGEPGESDAAAYWAAVDHARVEMTRDIGRWRRIRAALSLRSFVPRRAIPVRTVVGATR